MARAMEIVICELKEGKQDGLAGCKSSNIPLQWLNHPPPLMVIFHYRFGFCCEWYLP
jgi:hypothetical protein